MKDIVLLLHLEHASHRRRLIGIFNAIDPASDWNVRIVSREDDLRKRLLDPEKPDGIIACSIESPETINAIVESDIPFVGMGIHSSLRKRRSVSAAYIQNDNEQIGQQAADYLCSCGLFRSYVYIGTANSEDWSQIRGNAFARRLAQNGHVCTTVPLNPDEKKLAKFLQTLPKPATLLAAWDGCASDIIRIARAARIRIPRDLSIIGVDNDELLCEHTSPTLTSINTDTEGVGHAAAKALERLMRSKRRRTLPILVKCPTLGIVERDSTTFVPPEVALITRARALVNQDTNYTLTPNDIAQKLKVSRRLLDLRFKQRENTTLSEILMTRRVERAKFLLTHSKYPAKTVFQQAGFSCIPHATRLFKKETGMTPLAWRGLHRVGSK